VKLSFILLAATAAGASLLATMNDRVTATPSSEVTNSTATGRQSRLSTASSTTDPNELATQIKAVQFVQSAPSGASTAPVEPGLPAVTPSQPTPPYAGRASDQAQATPGPNPSSTNTSDPKTDQVQPDLAALRYFATRGDTARLQAEIARLRALYPAWVPPDNPLAIPVNRDRRLEDMWRLYAEGQYAEVRKSVAARQASEPSWQPPQDLLERLDVVETRARLVNASDLKQFGTVVTLAASTPSLLNCGDPDVLWRLAEAFERTKRTQRSLDVYRYVLQNCTDPQQRLATVQKAADLLPHESFATLLSFEKDDEFASVRNDLVRRQVADANQSPGSAVGPDVLARLRELASEGKNTSDMLLLGWYGIRHTNMADAENWFRMARADTDSSSASQGLSLALVHRGAAAEAEQVMLSWKDDSEEAGAVYLAATASLLSQDPPSELPDDVLQRIAAAAFEKKYVPTAQLLGWYARAFGQPHTAARWFETALGWRPEDEPSAYGLAITLQQLNDRNGAATIQRSWAGRSDRIANLGLLVPHTARPSTTEPTPPERAATPQREVQSNPQHTAQLSRPRSAPVPQRNCLATGNSMGMSASAALSRGWCLMELNRPLEAAEAFGTALLRGDDRSRSDASYGQSLAYLRLGLTNKAAVAAAKAPQQQGRSLELQLAILADRANSAFNAGRFREAIVYLDQRARFQPEASDLMVLRAYALQNLGDNVQALRLFEAVAETGNRDAIRAAADLRTTLQ
jgi:cellulose synthase operon protein C